jgi:hypothetical protein
LGFTESLACAEVTENARAKMEARNLFCMTTPLLGFCAIDKPTIYHVLDDGLRR